MDQENTRRTLEQYLREKLCGAYIDIDQETKKHRQRFRKQAALGDDFAANIMEMDDLIQSLPVELNLAEHFGFMCPMTVEESKVEDHIKDYYRGCGFEFVGYNVGGFLDFRKSGQHLSVNLTTCLYQVLVSVHDKSRRRQEDG